PRTLAEQRQRVGDVRRAAAAPLVHGVDQEAEAHPVHVLRQEVFREPAGKRHQVVVGDRSGDDDAHARLFLGYWRYLPMIGASSRRTSAGIISGRVMMADSSAR